MKIDLKPKNEKDESFLFRLYAGTREEELSVLSWTPSQKDEFLQMQFKAQTEYYSQIYPDAEYNIILHDDEPAGRLIIARLENEIRVVDIAMIKKQRGKGTGELLLRKIMEEAEREGKLVVLHVEHLNRAKNLYVRLGFKAVENLGVYLRMEWRPKIVVYKSSEVF